MSVAESDGLDVDAEISAAITDISDGLGSDDLIAFASEVASPGRLSTGSDALDQMLDGGIPRGRITHMPGLAGSGRTTLAYAMIAKAQAAGERCAFIDADHRFNGARARALGVDTEKLVLLRPPTLEQAFAATERLILTGVIALIVLDSVGSTTPRAEYLGNFGDDHTGLLERRVAQGMRKLLGILSFCGTALVVTNQYWIDHTVMFGSKRFAPGDVDHFSALTLDVRRTTTLQRKIELPVETEPEPVQDAEATIAAIVADAEADEPVAAEADEPAPEPEKDTYGIRIRVKVTQNSDGPSYQEAHVHIVFAEGISREGDLVELGVALGVLTRRRGSAKIFFGETLLGVTEENAAEFLRDHCEVALMIEAEILAAQN